MTRCATDALTSGVPSFLAPGGNDTVAGEKVISRQLARAEALHRRDQGLLTTLLEELVEALGRMRHPRCVLARGPTRGGCVNPLRGAQRRAREAPVGWYVISLLVHI